MKIQLIEGDFKSNEALDLITQMIHVKIKYHENKIILGGNEEDIKRREKKIIRLQKELFELRNYCNNDKNSLKINSIVNVE